MKSVKLKSISTYKKDLAQILTWGSALNGHYLIEDQNGAAKGRVAYTKIAGSFTHLADHNHRPQDYTAIEQQLLGTIPASYFIFSTCKDFVKGVNVLNSGVACTFYFDEHTKPKSLFDLMLLRNIVKMYIELTNNNMKEWVPILNNCGSRIETMDLIFLDKPTPEFIKNIQPVFRKGFLGNVQNSIAYDIMHALAGGKRGATAAQCRVAQYSQTVDVSKQLRWLCPFHYHFGGEGFPLVPRTMWISKQLLDRNFSKNPVCKKYCPSAIAQYNREQFGD